MDEAYANMTVTPALKLGRGSSLPSWDLVKPWWVAAMLLGVPGDSGVCCNRVVKKVLVSQAKALVTFFLCGTALLPSCLSSGASVSQVFTFSRGRKECEGISHNSLRNENFHSSPPLDTSWSCGSLG